jgi:nucleoside-diphosphate kinase
MSAGAVLGFECLWWDNISGSETVLFLKFFLDDNTIEILTDGTRCLLKRIFYPDVTVRDLFVGNSISVYNRQMVIKKYCNEATQRYMGAREEHYLVTVAQEACSLLGSVFTLAKQYKLIVGKVRTVTSGPTPVIDTRKGDIAIEFVGYDKSVSARFIQDVAAVSRACEGTIVSIESVAELFDFLRSTNSYVPSPDCSLCLVKPHIIKEEKLGSFIDAVVAGGFAIDAAYLVHLTIPMAKEFLDVYKNVYPSFVAMIDQVVSGPVLALRIVPSSSSSSSAANIDGFGDGVVESFRGFCGPLNAELASKLRPKTLRARFGCTEPGGASLSHNAVHCTDLAEDGGMECTYFFSTLAAM